MAVSTRGKWRVIAEPCDMGNEWGIMIGRYDGEPLRTSIHFDVNATAKEVAAKLRVLAETIEYGMNRGE
jgi:hypothetical protein